MGQHAHNAFCFVADISVRLHTFRQPGQGRQTAKRKMTSTIGERSVRDLEPQGVERWQGLHAPHFGKQQSC